MSSGKLLIRSLLIILVLAGVPHLFARLSKSSDSEHQSDQKQVIKNTEKLVGIWKLEYMLDEENTQLYYQLESNEKGGVTGFLLNSESSGESIKSNSTKVFELTEFDGHTGKGMYSFQYRGYHYQIECQITLIDNKTLDVSYLLDGMKTNELWIKNQIRL